MDLQLNKKYPVGSDATWGLVHPAQLCRRTFCAIFILKISFIAGIWTPSWRYAPRKRNHKPRAALPRAVMPSNGSSKDLFIFFYFTWGWVRVCVDQAILQDHGLRMRAGMDVLDKLSWARLGSLPSISWTGSLTSECEINVNPKELTLQTLRSYLRNVYSTYWIWHTSLKSSNYHVSILKGHKIVSGIYIGGDNEITFRPSRTKRRGSGRRQRIVSLDRPKGDRG